MQESKVLFQALRFGIAAQLGHLLPEDRDAVIQTDTVHLDGEKSVSLATLKPGPGSNARPDLTNPAVSKDVAYRTSENPELA